MSNEDSNNNQASAVENLTQDLAKMTPTADVAAAELPAAAAAAQNGQPQAAAAASAPAETQPVEAPASEQVAEAAASEQVAAAPASEQVAEAAASEQVAAAPASEQVAAAPAGEQVVEAAASEQVAAAPASEQAPAPAAPATQDEQGKQEEGVPTTTATQQQATNGKCNLTLVLKEKLRMELEQRPLPPKPKAHEVQLATHTVGICGSDVKYWQCGKIGNFVLTKPMILGHETSAIVMDVGEQVRSLKPGDKVAVEVGLPCSTCQLCRSGKYNLCAQMAFAATPPYDGTLTRYFNHPANFCFKLPEAVSLEDGALLEPMAVAVHACQRAPIKLGDVVLVCGAGAVGLLSMLSARAFGASHVIITDISESRLEFAKQLGASETILVTREQEPSNVAALVRAFVTKVKPSSEGVDVVLECSGAQSSLHLAIHSAGVGAQIVCVGCQADTVTIPLNFAVMQEIDIKGVFRYRNCYPLAMSLVESGKIDLRPLVTHRFKLEDAVGAFETCFRGEGVKILIKCMDDKPNLDKS